MGTRFGLFQRESFEKLRSEKFVDNLKEKSAKIATVYIRSGPVMEVLTGVMIAILIFYSGNLIINDELGIGNFFSFLAAMMLAYQPVRSLATLNITINQGLAGAKRILPILDLKENIIEGIMKDRKTSLESQKQQEKFCKDAAKARKMREAYDKKLGKVRYVHT